MGYFDEVSFGRGYEEENDFAMRAHKLNYIHLLDDATFIFHEGEQSFTSSSDQLRKQNNYEIMKKRYPHYHALDERFQKEKPLSKIHEAIFKKLSSTDKKFLLPYYKLRVRNFFHI